MDAAQKIVALCEIMGSDTPNPELISQANDQLCKMLEIPDTLFILINLFTQSQNHYIRAFSTTGIKTILSNDQSWPHYIQSGQSEELKNIFIQILRNESNQYMFTNILSGIAKILSIEYPTWPEYLELIHEFSQIEGKFLNAMQMSNEIVSKLNEDFVSSIWDFMCNLSLQGLSTANENIILESSHLISRLFRFSGVIESNLPELFSALLQVFGQLISSGSSACNQIIEDFESIASVDQFCLQNTSEIVQQFLTIVVNPTLSIDLRCFTLGPVVNFIVNDPSFDASSVFGQLYDVLFGVSANSFSDELCSDELENMNYIQGLLEVLLQSCDARVAYSAVRSKGDRYCGTNNISGFVNSGAAAAAGEIAAYALSIATIATNHPDVLVHDIATFVRFAFACIETKHHSLQEVGYELLAVLFGRKSDVFLDGGIQKHLFEVTFQVLSVDHSLLILKALRALHQFFGVVDVSGEFVAAVVSALLQVLRAYPAYPQVQSTVIDCLTALAESLADDVAPFAVELVPIVMQAATLRRTEEFMMKASAVECLGAFVRYCPQMPGIDEMLQIFVECIQSGDDLLISSGFLALRQTVISGVPQLAACLPTAFQVAHAIFQVDPTFQDDVDKEFQNDVMLDVWTFSMNFIAEVAKRIPESLQTVVADFQRDLIRLIEKDQKEELQVVFIKTAAALHRLTPDSLPDFIVFLAKLLVDTNSDREAASLFRTIGRFLRDQGAAVPQNVIECCCEVGIQGMDRELSFQGEGAESESNYDIDFGAHLYRFFKVVCSSVPHLFPINDFWKRAQTILAKGVVFEQAEVVSVLTTYYSAAHDKIPSILKKVMIRDAFVNTLPMCDCFTTPDPLAAVRAVVETEPKLIENYLQQILPFLEQTLATEYDDQLLYNMTMEYTVSLLFSLFRVVLKEQFDVAKFVPKMLQMLPATTAEGEAANIYFSLAFVCGEYPQAMGHFSPEIIRVIAQTLAMKEKEWREINLPMEYAQSIAILLRNLLNAMQQGNEILHSVITDQMSMQRFQQRMIVLTNCNI